MEAEQIHEVIKALVGPIQPVADGAIDNIREKNLRKFIEVFEKMHVEVDSVEYQHQNSKFGSCKRLATIAGECLTKMGITND